MRIINCRIFQAQVADWKSDRLSQEESQCMADHLCRCGDCAGEAQAETQMRELWRTERTAPLKTDLWQRVSRRLESDGLYGSRAFSPSLRPRRALAGSVALTVLAVCFLWVGPKEVSRTAPEALPALHTASPPLRAAAWTVLPDIARVDPAVDDPAGATTERVWGLVNARPADAP